MSKIDLIQGTLDGLILKALSLGPKHGFAVAHWIRDASRDTFQIETGALYPALHRMELKGWVEAEWGASENNRRAKFYQLTAKGRRAFSGERDAWFRYADAVGWVFGSAEDVPS